jgi:non-heme chloroperoxidase
MKKLLLGISFLFLLGLVAQSIIGVKKEQLGSFSDHGFIDQPKLTVKKINLKTGVELEYAEQGNRNGIPVIFLHGITDSWHSFEKTFSYLPGDIHAFAITQRGHGNSGKPSTGYTSKHFAADVAAFVNQRKLEKVIIVGHSMGGINAMQFAIDYPHLTKALVIMNSDPQLGLNPGMPEFVKEVSLLKGNNINREFMTAFQAATLATPIDSADFKLYVDEGLKCPLRVFQTALTGLAEINLLSEMKTVKVATAIFWGDKDAFFLKEGQDALKNSVPHARQYTYNNMGHAVHWEQPQRFANDLTQFIHQSLLNK